MVLLIWLFISKVLVAQASRLCIFLIIFYIKPGVIFPSIDQFLL